MLAKSLTHISYALSLVAAASIYIGFRLVRKRWFFHSLPKPPHSFVWGHLQLLREVRRPFPRKPSLQAVVTYIRQHYDLPDVFYLDLWPVGPTLLLITSAEAAHHAFQTRVYGKHPAVAENLGPLLGENVIAAVNGPMWKSLHKMLAPAFRPSSIRAVLQSAARESVSFTRTLEEVANSGAVIAMEQPMKEFIFAVEQKMVLGATAVPKEDATQFMDDVLGPIEWSAALKPGWSWRSVKANYITKRRCRAAVKRSTTRLEQIIEERFHELKRDNAKTGDCLLDTILIERIQQDEKDGSGTVSHLDPAWISVLISNLRGVIFAGEFSTVDTLQFTYMMLSVHPEAVQKLRQEHDRVAGPTTDSTIALIDKAAHRLAELEYTTAVLKETLRLYPVGASARYDDKDGGTFTHDGQEYPTKDCLILGVTHTMHYNPRNFPEPSAFRPERFMDKGEASMPTSAFRPFELGPRACMGKEQALGMMRVILLLTVRWFDFTVADNGTGASVPRKAPRVPYTDMDLKLGDMAFQLDAGIEAKPRFGCPMSIKRTERPF